MTDLLGAAQRQGSSLQETEHRPWPLPTSSWVMGQTWDDLLFAHWRVDAKALRAHVPDELELDEHSDSAWIGVTPFVVTGLRARGLLPLPLVSSFRELNVRTYVTVGGKPGIWFFSLDASSQAAVEAARRIYRLPYFRAQIDVERRGERILYECARHEGKAFSGEYGPAGDVSPPAPGSLEYFLTERYCLYARDGAHLYRADIHHRPWPLQKADGTIDLNTMPPAEIALEDEPLLHFSRQQDVAIWPLERVQPAET